jgi:hypothetical protein
VDRSRRGFSQIFLAFTTQTNRHRAGGGTTGASAVGPATIATVVGGGVIGISWTALFLAHGRT